MINNIPLILQKKDEDQAVFTARLDRQLPYFQGHFPKQPLLPGVIQLLWAQQLAQKYLLPVNYVAKKLPMVKFISPLIPDDEIVLTLNMVNKDNNTEINFTYERKLNNSNVVASKGKIVFEKSQAG